MDHGAIFMHNSDWLTFMRERLFVVLTRLLLLAAALVAEDSVAMPTLVGMLTALGESFIILICGTLSQFVLHQHKLRTSMEILLLKSTKAQQNSDDTCNNKVWLSGIHVKGKLLLP